MARRGRKFTKKLNLKKFFRDYPIVPLIAVIFALGVWLGFGLGQKSVTWRFPAKQVQTFTEAPKKQKLDRTVPAVVVPAVTLPKGSAQKQEVVKIARILPPVPSVPKPKIALVIDDIGYNKRYADLLFSLDRHLTLAILPQLPYSRYFAEEAKKRGFDTILHLPLEPEDKSEDPGPGEITVQMSAHEMSAVLEENLKSVPGAIGVNNHMGSLATRNRSVMYLVLKELKRRGLFFLDSMTHPGSVAYHVAYGVGVPAAKRDVFLDNEGHFDYVMQQIDETAKIAKQAGNAVAIGHYRENTLAALKQAIAQLKAQGFEIVALKDLM
ncbi:MAG: divergent polysaccharide deacetylase family protein [Candidatus Omnitrophica bacterium]|nr:divergent polysaccharide deacetylase family protein [Candidatus Omnitrophota bacterium]